MARAGAVPRGGGDVRVEVEAVAGCDPLRLVPIERAAARHGRVSVRLRVHGALPRPERVDVPLHRRLPEHGSVPHARRGADGVRASALLGAVPVTRR